MVLQPPRPIDAQKPGNRLEHVDVVPDKGSEIAGARSERTSGSGCTVINGNARIRAKRLSQDLSGADDQWILCSKRQLFLSLLRPYNTHTTVCGLYGVSVVQLCGSNKLLSSSGRHRPNLPPADPRADREGNRRAGPIGRLGHREDTDQRRSGSYARPDHQPSAFVANLSR
jgi:hypothetical protein